MFLELVIDGCCHLHCWDTDANASYRYRQSKNDLIFRHFATNGIRAKMRLPE